MLDGGSDSSFLGFCSTTGAIVSAIKVAAFTAMSAAGALIGYELPRLVGYIRANGWKAGAAEYAFEAVIRAAETWQKLRGNNDGR